MSGLSQPFVLSSALRRVEHITRKSGLRPVELSPDCCVEIGSMGEAILRVAWKMGEVAVSTAQADLLAEMRYLIDCGLLCLIDEEIDDTHQPSCYVSRAKLTADGERAALLLSFEPVHVPVVFIIEMKFNSTSKLLHIPITAADQS